MAQHRQTPEQIEHWLQELGRGRDRHWAERRAMQEAGIAVPKHPSGWPKGRKRGPRKKPIVYDLVMRAMVRAEEAEARLTNTLPTKALLEAPIETLDQPDLLTVGAIEALRANIRDLRALGRMIEDAETDKDKAYFIDKRTNIANQVIKNKIRVDEGSMRGRRNNAVEQMLADWKRMKDADAAKTVEAEAGTNGEAHIAPASKDFDL